MKEKKPRRFILTINNPFFNNDDFEEVDINNTILPLKLDYLKNEFLKSLNVVDFFEFKYIKWQVDNQDCVIERAFFKDIDCVKKYIEELEHIKYSIFQLEKGEKETEHIQAFINFTIGKRFNTIKTYFPSAHIEPVKGTSVQARDYCSKTDTKIGETYEVGEFAEERSRTDISNFVDCVLNNMSDEELCKLYPSLYVKEINKISQIRNNLIFNKFSKEIRDVKVVYIWGAPRTGKTRYIMNKYGLGNYYSVDNYGYTAFDEYSGEDVIVFDEYDSQIDITYINKLLDMYPVKLRARYGNKMACYTKVYIVSNLSLSGQYIDIQKDVSKRVKYEAFVSRIDSIIKFHDNGTYTKTDLKNEEGQQQLSLIHDDEELKEVEKLFGGGSM